MCFSINAVNFSIEAFSPILYFVFIPIIAVLGDPYKVIAIIVNVYESVSLLVSVDPAVDTMVDHTK